MADRDGNKAMGFWIGICLAVLVGVWLFLRSCSV